MCRGIVEHVGENLPFARGNVVLLHVQTAQALAGRLRQERNQARQDALRYNQEQNEARAEIVALRTQQSAAAVRSALAPIFPLSAE